MRRLAVTHDDGGWTVNERWTSNGLKPYFNDFVVHKGTPTASTAASSRASISRTASANGRADATATVSSLLLPDQDLLLVLSEEGELALVGATPDEFTELARFQAIEGKTWNHPVLVGDSCWFATAKRWPRSACGTETRVNSRV